MKRFLSSIAVLLSLEAVAQTVRGGNDASGSIPMRYDRYLYLQGVVNDTLPGRFVFDLGAQVTQLDSEWVIRHGLRFDRIQIATLVGNGERTETALYSTDTLVLGLGSGSYASSPNVIAPLSELMPGVDGLVGAAVFRDRILRIDYEAGSLAVLPPEAVDTLTSDRYERQPFTIDERNFIELPVTVVIDSARRRTIRGTVFVDTGSPGEVGLRASERRLQQWRRLARRGGRYVYFVPLLGFGGGGSVEMIRAQAVRIGGYELPLRTVELRAAKSEEKEAEEGSQQIGAIGNALLSRFGCVVFDMQGRQAYLPRGRRFDEVPPQVDYSGFRLGRVDHWFVNGISHPAVELRNGDRVTHLDGHAIEELDERQRDAYFCTPDRHYRVTVVRGGEVLDIQVVNLNEKTRWH